VIKIDLTPLQRQLLCALLADPGAGAGRLKTIVGARSRGGVTRSLKGLLALDLVRRQSDEYTIERYFLTDDGRVSAQTGAAA
jgi:DNA-binding MarR family transcriptional regulator